MKYGVGLWFSLALLSPISAASGQSLPTYPAVRPSGRLQFDGARYFPDIKHLVSGTELRRLRLAVGGDLSQRLHFLIEIDFADNEVLVRDAWLTYDLNPHLRLQAGHFKEPLSLDQLTSSLDISFMERSLIDGVVPGRNLGIAVRGNYRGVTGMLGGFGQNAGSIGEPDFDNSEAIGMSMRLTAAPVQRERRLIHLGAAARWRTPDAQADDDRNTSFDAPDETNVDRTVFYDTGNISQTDWYGQFGVEGALIYGPLFLQAEGMATQVSRDTVTDPSFGGGYVFLSVIPTGEARIYDARNGVIGSITAPRHKWGALELLVRWSTIDLNEGVITGGAGHNWTLAANWYPQRNLKMMVNYVITDHDVFATGDGQYAAPDNFRVLQARLQYFFR
ncbi:MAG: OprO/OprP family phosphate-selective porin [Longimicrobiales bacterium]